MKDFEHVPSFSVSSSLAVPFLKTRSALMRVSRTCSLCVVRAFINFCTPEGGTSQLYHATPWDLCKNTLECVINPRATPSGLSNIPSCILHRSLEGMV